MSAHDKTAGPTTGDGTRLRGTAHAGGPKGSPRAVTRGESPQQASKPQKANVDWLNVTFPAPSMSVEGMLSLLSRMLGRPIAGVESRGMLGFEKRVDIIASVGSGQSTIGCFAHGGDSQNGRWLFQLTGSGCGLVRDWEGIADLFESLDGRITRLDLAVDFLQGEYSVDDAMQAVEMDGFTGHGRAPSIEICGDWHHGIRGRTMYVGRPGNGKRLRVYEKGRQLGDARSDWTRWEVQFGNRDREIPFRAITQRDSFFAGAYPALEELIGFAGETIRTFQTDGQITLAHLIKHARRSYGKLFDTLSGEAAADSASLVEEFRVFGLPRRVNPSSVAAGVTWADVLAQFKRLAA